MLRTGRGFGWANLRKAQEERKERLAELVGPHFMPWCVQLGHTLEKSLEFLENGPPRRLDVKGSFDGCQMPLTKRASCVECTTVGRFGACSLGHMRICGAPIFLACNDCDRVLCWEHIPNEEKKLKCYCKSQLVAIGGAAVKERARVSERERAREREKRK